MFLQLFSHRIWSQMQFTVKWFPFTFVKALSFLLPLNNLGSLVFLEIPGLEYIFVLFLYVNILISWFILTLASVGEIAEYTAAHLQRLEDAGKLTSRKICKHILTLKKLSQSTFLFRRRHSSSNCSFIVYCKRLLPTPFCEFLHVTAPNRHAQVRFRPIVRRVRNPPIRNAHIYPCDSARYQNNLSAVTRRLSIQIVWTMRGPAATQARE